MTMRYRVIFGLALLATALLIGTTTAYAQAPSKQPARSTSDTVFTEIKLTSDGVVAVDSNGNQWTYDFEKDVFVPSATAGTASGHEASRATDEAFAGPVEQRCTEKKVVKPFQRTVLVGYEEYVDGDIIAYGRVTVKGWVKGNIQSVSGRVMIAESGQVDGDIKAPEIVVRNGAKVKGQQITTDPFLDFPTNAFSKSFSGEGLVIVLGFTFFLLIIGFLALSLIPRQMDNFSRCIAEHRLKSFLLGFLLIFMFPLLLLLLIITIVGIVLVPFLPMAYVVAGALGVVGVGGSIGQALTVKLFSGRRNNTLEALGGTLLFMLLWAVVAVLLGASDSVSNGFGILFLVISIMASVYPFCSGLGAALLTRFGYRQYVSFGSRHPSVRGEAPAPAPPPIPQAPSIDLNAAPPVPPRFPGRESPQGPLSSDSR
ncbi:MAG TPA: polymer-forming cytoskeletal protein [Candidatus Acidoferrum sp.]|nr:polymer-forming cytoskeletal protein [Candidatus Acidoferrum sp.]